MTSAAGEQRLHAARAGSSSLSDRVLAAAPLASVYLWLAIVYLVEAWKRVTPWLWTDELEMTQIARSIAATGHPARRGQPYTFHSLYTVLTAPLWLIHDVATAYAGIKYFDVLLMTAVVFPAYGLARLVVGRPAALFAAAGSAAIPALAYSSYIVEEPLAYPYAALCLFLIAKALRARSRRWVAAAVVASAVAPAVRGELIVVPLAFAVAALLVLWSSEAGRRRRRRWSLGDNLGLALLVVGVAVGVSGFLSRYSAQWYEVSTFWKHRAFVLGDWAAGSLAIGMGVAPFVGGLTALFPARGETPSEGARIFRSVAVAGLFAFGLYTGMKATYLANHFAMRVEERNLIYVAPLLFVGTAMLLERRRVNVLALAAASGYTLYLICGTPFHMETQLYSDALGLAVLEQANRYYEWTTHTVQWLMIGVLALGSVVLLAVHALGLFARRAAAVLALAAAAGMLAWNVTAEVAAAAGTVSYSRDLVPTLTRPFTWVDDHAHGAPTLYLAQGVGDQNPEWLLEFWNRSIVSVSSIDGTLGGPGPAGSPNTTADGEIYWGNSPRAPSRQYAYAVEDWPCIDFVGTLAATHHYRSGGARGGDWRLVRLTRPNRLRSECSGIYADGWSGAADSTYFRFVSSRRPGWLRIGLSRGQWSSTPVTVEIATIATRDQEPVLGRRLRTVRLVLPSKTQKTVWLRAPRVPFGVRTFVVKKFVPGGGDRRLLGALVSYAYVSERPRTRR